MSSNDFLKQLEEAREIAKEFGQSGQGMITKVKIELGFGVAYLPQEDGDKMKFWKVCMSKNEAKAVSAEVEAILKQHNIKNRFGGDMKPEYCLRVFVSNQNILNPDWNKYDWDYNEFHPEWSWNDRNGETCFDLIVKSIQENNLPMGQTFWGAVHRVHNPFKVRQGEAGKTNRWQNDEGVEMADWPRFCLPVKAFASEEEARAAAGGGQADGDVKWSDTARANYPDLSVLENMAAEINTWVGKAMAGEAFNGDSENYPLPNPLSPPEAKAYIANIYDIEPSDIDQLETPF